MSQVSVQQSDTVVKYDDADLSRLDLNMKASPLDFAAFRGEILNKYPTYDPPSIPTPLPYVPLDRIVAAAASAPLKQSFQVRTSSQGDNNTTAANQSGPPAPGPLPATPAPSPPPSPPPVRPKKQQYQTDQSKPFVLPFSRANVGGGHYSMAKGKGKMTVPYSIDEAGKLYHRNIRISTELWQTWKLREEYLADETGSSSNEDRRQVEDDVYSQRINGLAKHFDAMSLENGEPNSEAGNKDRMKGDAPDALSMLYQLEATVKADLRAHKKSVPSGEQGSDFHKRTRKITQRIEDVKRLQRIEIIYVGL